MIKKEDSASGDPPSVPDHGEQFHGAAQESDEDEVQGASNDGRESATVDNSNNRSPRYAPVDARNLFVSAHIKRGAVSNKLAPSSELLTLDARATKSTRLTKTTNIIDKVTGALRLY